MASALILLMVLILFRHKPKAGNFIALGVVLFGLALAWTMLHPRQTPLMDDARMVQEMIGAGKPVLLEFQSPY